MVIVGFHIPRSLGLLFPFGFHTNPFRIRCPTFPPLIQRVMYESKKRAVIQNVQKYMAELG